MRENIICNMVYNKYIEIMKTITYYIQFWHKVLFNFLTVLRGVTRGCCALTTKIAGIKAGRS